MWVICIYYVSFPFQFSNGIVDAFSLVLSSSSTQKPEELLFVEMKSILQAGCMTLHASFAQHVNIIHQTFYPDGQDRSTFEASYCLPHMVHTCLSIHAKPNPIMRLFYATLLAA
jgi:hypothetical protein